MKGYFYLCWAAVCAVCAFVMLIMCAFVSWKVGAVTALCAGVFAFASYWLVVAAINSVQKSVAMRTIDLVAAALPKNAVIVRVFVEQRKKDQLANEAAKDASKLFMLVDRQDQLVQNTVFVGKKYAQARAAILNIAKSVSTMPDIGGHRCTSLQRRHGITVTC